jgi:hypothetical protein
VLVVDRELCRQVLNMDKFLEALGMKFDDLNSAERDTYFGWLKVLEKQNVKIEDVRSFITHLRQAVDNELALHNLTKSQDLFLKARLKNLILIEGFLTGPEQARKALESYIHNLKK